MFDRVDKFAHAGLNESPSEKEGKCGLVLVEACVSACLNESPSEKEGKCPRFLRSARSRHLASMKVPPKRKGNRQRQGIERGRARGTPQ